MSDVTNDDLTIDEIAHRTGMTARNIRAHQSRGLLPPPEMRGRTGYYGAEHVARIQLIRELQDEGFTLEAIRRLIERANGSSAEILRFTRVLREPFEDEAPEIVTAEELAQRWKDVDPAMLDRSVKLGLLRPLTDGTFEIASPRLQHAADELTALGLSQEQALDLAAELRKHADRVAHVYAKLFLEHVWKPFEADGSPEERWPEVRSALERLRPLAGESLVAMFGLAMNDAIDHEVGREVARLERGAPSRTAGVRRRRSRG
ncbi:MAG: MerR family transcriptional regulator [Thermoleophilaceae bacterium]